MSKKRQRKSWTQTAFWVLSLIMVLSMVISLVIVALPGPPAPSPTPLPTWTPRPSSTALPPALPSPSAAASATITATQPVVGPESPDATATPTSVLDLAPPLQPTATPTINPAAAARPATMTANRKAAATLPVSEAVAAPDLVFAVAGDSRHNPGVYRRLLAAVAGSGAEFLINTGDLVDEGSDEQWQVFKETMADFSLPFYPVPGNHDGLGGALDGYLAHSGAPAAHYAFDRGPARFVLADSHHGGINAAELAWMRQELESTTQPVKIVVMHHPPFDPDGTDHIMAWGNDDVMALLAEMQVDAVFVGHIHAYVHGERDGVPYYITGGGGAPLYGGDHPQAFHHYLKVTIRGEQVIVDVVAI